MSKSAKKNDYEVGYGRTPRNGRWKPGQSGNPAGRKKGSKNKPTTMAQAIAEELAKEVEVTIDGKRQMVDVNRYIAMRFARLMCSAKALADIKRGAQIAEMLDIAGAQQRLIDDYEYRQYEEESPDSFTEEDRRMLGIVRDMLEADDGDDASQGHVSGEGVDDASEDGEPR